MTMMVEDKCGMKTWTLVNGKWKEHSCIKRRPVTESTHREQEGILFHRCDDGFRWPVEGTEEQPWKKNLPSHEEVIEQMQKLIGV